MNPSKTRLNILNLLMLCCLAALLSSCATKIPYKSVKNQLPPINAGNARIFVYSLGGSIIFDVSIDDEDVASVTGAGCAYVDHSSGKCTLTIRMRGFIAPRQDLALDLAPGETQYVQVELDHNVWGARCRAILMDPDQGSPDLDQCYLLNPIVPKS